MKKLYASLMLLALSLVGCSSLRSTAATLVPGIRLTLTAASLPPLTQTALRVPTRYVTPTRAPVSIPTPTPHPPGYPALLETSVASAACPYPPCHPLPAPTPTAIVHWSVPVTEVRGLNPEFMRGLSWEPQSTPAATNPPAFDVRCEGAVLSLYRLSENVPVSAVEMTSSDDCPVWTQWAANAVASVIVTRSGEVYLWRTDGTPPLKVGNAIRDYGNEYRLPLWSPGSEHVALILAEAEAWPRSATVRVVSLHGDVRSEFQIGGGVDGEGLYWLANDVVCRGDRNISPCHKASTGQYLFNLQGWHIVTSGGVVPQQPPTISPDQRWILVDQSHADDQAIVNDRWTIRSAYVLFDVEKPTEYLLPASGSNPLAFAGWRSDSSAVYLISRPREAGALPMPGMPFGLLALNVRTRQLELLFKEAMHVAWSPGHQWAFVIFPVRNTGDSLGLAGGIWRVATDALIGRVPVATGMIYGDPGWDSYFGGPDSFGAPAWSPDAQWVVFGDAQGGLHLMETDGTVRRLALDESGGSWLDAEFTWSSDSQNLLAQRGNRAWLLTLSAP